MIVITVNKKPQLEEIKIRLAGNRFSLFQNIFKDISDTDIFVSLTLDVKALKKATIER